MSWNHRVVKHKDDGFGRPYYAIHEAYYDVEDPDFLGWTADPIRVIGEDIDGLRWTLNKMLESLDKPVIDASEE